MSSPPATSGLDQRETRAAAAARAAGQAAGPAQARAVSAPRGPRADQAPRVDQPPLNPPGPAGANQDRFEDAQENLERRFADQSLEEVQPPQQPHAHLTSDTLRAVDIPKPQNPYYNKFKDEKLL